MDDPLATNLLAVLRTVTDTPTLDYAAPPVRLTGGFWADLVAFRLLDPPEGLSGDLVARVMPDPVLARKETILQAEVAAQGYPAPTVRRAGGPHGGLGGALRWGRPGVHPARSRLGARARARRARRPPRGGPLPPGVHLPPPRQPAHRGAPPGPPVGAGRRPTARPPVLARIPRSQRHRHR